MRTNKTSNNGNDNGGTAEISIFALNIKGGEAIVQSAIQQFAKAGFSVALPQTPKPPPVSLPAPGASAQAKPRAGQTELTFDEAPAEAEETAEVAPTTTPRLPRPRAFTPLEPLPELNVNDAPMPFRDFVNGRAIDGFNERGLVAATWVRDHRQTKTFGSRHMATCFKAMSWKMPDDPGSLLRNMKKANLVKSAGPALYEITTVGDNEYAGIK